MPNAASNAIDYAKFRSRSHHAVIRVYDEAGNAIEDARARGPVQRIKEPLVFSQRCVPVDRVIFISRNSGYRHMPRRAE